MTKQLLLGNWNVDESDYDELPLSSEDIEKIFTSDKNDVGPYTITADIALGGKDNLVVMVWKGLHCIDMVSMERCTANEALV